MWCLLCVGIVCAWPSHARRHRRPRKITRDMQFVPTVAEVTVRAGDTLWGVTDRVTGRPWVWPRIWALNPHLTNPHWLVPGTRISFVSQKIPEHTLSVAQPSLIGESDTEGALGHASPPKKPPIEFIGEPPEAIARASAARLLPRRAFVSEAKLSDSGKVSNASPDRLLLRAGDELYLTFAKGHTPRPGERFVTFRTDNTIRHPTGGHHIGYLTEVTGAGVVDEVQDSLVRAHLDRSFSEVARDQYASVVPATWGTTPPPPANGAHAQGIVLAIEAMLPAGSARKLIFIDRGKAEGLVPGTRVRLLGAPDPMHPTLAHDGGGIYRPREKGLAVVLEAEAHAATCLILDSKREIWPGDTFLTQTAADLPGTHP